MEQDVVMLVHGTFADAESDEGHLWWQIGSDFQTALADRQSAQECGSVRFQPFHWSGENDFLRRYQAGQELFEQFDEWEEAGINYHVVAHSHGGTVLLHALEIASMMDTHKKRGFWAFGRAGDDFGPLARLKTCITVGTPFVHFAEPRVSRLWSFVIEFALFAGILAAGAAIAASAIASGHYSSALWVLLVLPAMALAWQIVRGLKFARMQHLNPSMIKGYAGAWVSLWHEMDEAINLLGAAQRTQLSALEFPKARPTLDPNIRTPRRWLANLFFGWEAILSAIHNTLLRPFLGSFLRASLLKRLFGVPFISRVVGVSGQPPHGKHLVSALDPLAAKEIEAIAQERLSRLSPALRAQLMMAAHGPGNEPLRIIQQSAGALIHTAYLESEIVIDILARTIADRQGDTRPL